MAYKFSKGNRGLGDITFEDDADTGIDFEADTIKLETGGQETVVVTNGNMTVAGDIGVDQYIKHNGDADTLINFTDDKIVLKAGNIALVTVEKNSSQPHEVTINDGSNNVDFVVKGNGSNEGNPGMKFDASSNKLGINGVGTPEHELHVDGTGKFTTSIQTALLEYTDGDDAITIEDGGYLKFHKGVRYARSVQVSSADSPAGSGGNPDGGWVKFATFNCPGTSNLDVAASSFLITLAGMESSNNRRLDGIFMVHAKFTVSTGGNADGGSNYYESEGTRISCEPLNADFLAPSGAYDFDPATDLIMITTNDDSTPVVDLYIRSRSKDKYCFVTHLGGTGQNDTFDTDPGWTINTGESWVATEPAAPGGSAKITGTWVSKVFSALKVTGNDVRIKLDGATDSHPGLELYENGTRKWIVYNDYSDDKLAFKTDADVRMVIEQDGKVGIGSASPSHKLDIDGDIRVRGNDIRDNSGNPAITFDGSANTEVVNSLLVGGGVYKKVRDVGSTGNIATTDYMIRGIQNNSMTLTLPSKTNNSGQILVIKDMLGNAGSPNNKTITIDGDGSDTIDGSANYVINTNRGSVTLMCDGINGWMIIGKYSG